MCTSCSMRYWPHPSLNQYVKVFNCVAHGENLSHRRWWWLGSQADMEVAVIPQPHRQGDRPSQENQDFAFCIESPCPGKAGLLEKPDRWSPYPGAWAQCSYQSKWE